MARRFNPLAHGAWRKVYDRHVCATGVLISALGAFAGCSESANSDDASDESAIVTDDEAVIGGGDSESDESEASEPSECARDPYVAERTPVNVYLLLDVSGSMHAPIGALDWTTYWDAVRDALANFIDAPTSAGLNLALNYYPVLTERTACDAGEICDDGSPCLTRVCSLQLALENIITPCRFDDDCTGAVPDEETGELLRETCMEPLRCDDDPQRLCLVDGQCDGRSCATPGEAFCPPRSACEIEEYENAAVQRQLLPGGADVLVASLQTSGPDGFGTTPSQVALQGAYSEVAGWIEAEPNTQSIVVLATDGTPFGCNPTVTTVEELELRSMEQTLEAISDGAAAGIDTYVVGVLPEISLFVDQAAAQQFVDGLVEGLNDMARAGGTEASFGVTVDDTEAAGFRQALEQIRGQVLPCEYSIPEPSSGSVSFGRLNVELTRDGETEVVPKVEGESDCGDDAAWYYNTEAGDEVPTQVVLCPATCSAANSASGNQIDIVLGCQTVIRVR